MAIDTSIFKSYDIRGVYPTSVNEDTAYLIGQAYAQLISSENPGKKLTIVVSGDMRLSTPSLKERLISGLIDSGVNVVDIGMATTPTFYFAVAFYGYDGGIQVSASHNPKEYNGFKMVRSRGVPISGDTGIYTIRDAAAKGEFIPALEKGTLTKKEGVLNDEVEKESVGVDIGKIKPFKIVADVANAMGALDVSAMFDKYPGELIKLNFELDGNFPVHQPDPLDEKNLEFCKKAVVEHKADFGISVDGDADRYFLIDEKGATVTQEI
jgi:phosphomannomutase